MKARRPLVVAAAALLLAGCAAPGGRRHASGAPSEQAAPPPAGGWLADEAGRRYAVERVPRGQAQQIGPHEVRNLWGIRLEVVREDEGSYYVKRYREEPEEAAPLVADDAAPDPAAARAIAESYRIRIREGPAARLEPFGRGLPAAGQWREGFALADLDGDGRIDIVHGPPRKHPGPPAVFLGDGAGGWRRWSEARWPALPYDYGAAAVGDLTGDGRPDLVLGVHLRGVLVLSALGDGAFAASGNGVDFATSRAAFSSRAVGVTDWDGDGRPDILALGEGPRVPAPGAPAPGALGVRIYRNEGDGSFTARDEAAGPGRTFGAALALGDFDGDGRIDAAIGSATLGRRDILVLAGPGGAAAVRETAALRPAAMVRSVAAADFDRDGRSDLAVAYRSFEGGLWRAGIDVLLSPAGGAASVRVGLTAADGAEGPSAVGAGDFDGDGDADVAAVTDAGTLLLFRGDGRGSFERAPVSVPPYGSGCRGTHVALADLDGDGADEIVASFAEEGPEPGIAAFAEEEEPEAQGCPTEGGLAAWKRTAPGR